MAIHGSVSNPRAKLRKNHNNHLMNQKQYLIIN